MKNFLVIGQPIKHSLSLILHNYWIKENNLQAVYEKKEITKEKLAIWLAVKQKINEANIAAIARVIPHLDQLTEADQTQSIKLFMWIRINW